MGITADSKSWSVGSAYPITNTEPIETTMGNIKFLFWAALILVDAVDVSCEIFCNLDTDCLQWGMHCNVALHECVRTKERSDNKIRCHFLGGECPEYMYCDKFKECKRVI